MKTRMDRIGEIMEDLNQPSYRLDQVMEAIYRQDEIRLYSEVFNLPKEVREALVAGMGDNILSLREVTAQKEGATEKVLFETHDGHKIETVRMHYKGGRDTVCVSVQVGCGMGCAFCATGRLGFSRNLSVDEIVDQVLYFRKAGQKVDNVVFMGMGEPFANPATFEALGVITDHKKLGLGQRRVSVSTVGLVPGIKRMTVEQPQINLALSLHSPFQWEREKIMPVAKSYHISDVMTALEAHILETNRKVLIAYVLLGGVNDTRDHAEALAALLNSYKQVRDLWHVNLLNYHEVSGIDFKRSSEKNVIAFREVLHRKGIRNTLRQDFGEGIDAACGQLSGSHPG